MHPRVKEGRGSGPKGSLQKRRELEQPVGRSRQAEAGEAGLRAYLGGSLKDLWEKEAPLWCGQRIVDEGLMKVTTHRLREVKHLFIPKTLTTHPLTSAAGLSHA